MAARVGVVAPILTIVRLSWSANSQKEANRKRSQTRVRVEHVFGSQLQLAGDLVIRTIGIVRAKTKIGLRNLSYNLNRYSLLSSKAVAQ